MTTLTVEQATCRPLVRATMARLAAWYGDLDPFDKPSPRLSVLRQASAAVDAAARAGDVAATRAACRTWEQAWHRAASGPWKE